MDDYDSRIAVLGVTNEEVTSSGVWSQVAYVKSNIAHPALPLIHKVPVHVLCDAKPGEKFRCGPASLTMCFPYREDHIKRERVNGHAIDLYKVGYCNGITFSYKDDTHYHQLTQEVISLAQDRLVLPKRGKVIRFVKTMFYKKTYTRPCTKWDRRDQAEKIPITIETPCRLFFPGDLTMQQIGKPIEERFGLENLNVGNGLLEHAFRLDKKVKDAFYRKHPLTLRRTDEFTLRRLCEMTYDLVLIKHGRFL